MNKLVVGMKLAHKVNGEVGYVTELGEKITVEMATGETKSYALSSLKRLFKVIQEDVTEDIITNQFNEELPETAVTNKEEEVNMENNNEVVNSNVITEEEIDLNNKLAAQEKLMAEAAEKAAAIEKAQNEFSKSLEQIEDKPESKPEPKKESKPEEKKDEETKPAEKPESKKEVAPKVNLKAKFDAMVAEIISRMEKDESYKDLKVRPLTNNYASVKVTRNFVDLGVTSKNLKVSVLGLQYNSTLEPKVVPDSFGWRLNTIFTVTEDSQLEEVLRIIKLSYLEEVKPNEKDLAKAKAKAEKEAKVAAEKAAKEAKARAAEDAKQAKKIEEIANKVAKKLAATI